VKDEPRQTKKGGKKDAAIVFYRNSKAKKNTLHLLTAAGQN